MDKNISLLISKFTDSKIYKVIGLILGAVMFIIFFSISLNESNFRYIVHLMVFTSLIFFILNPALKLISRLAKDDTPNFVDYFSLVMRSGLLILIFTSVYNILASGTEILYSHYKLVGISLLILIILEVYRIIRNILNDKDRKIKLVSFFGRGFILVTLLAFFLLQSDELFLNKRLVHLGELERPSYMSIRRHDGKINASDFTSIIKEENVLIKDKEIIDSLFRQLSMKELENVRGISYIDYILKNIGRYPYYSLYLDYSKLNSKDSELSESYIFSITLYDNGMAVIYVFDREVVEMQKYIEFVSDELLMKITEYAD